MRALSTEELLTAWERGMTCRPAERAFALLVPACPDASCDTLAEMSVGARDAHLLALRKHTFGSHLLGTAECPSCGVRVEASFAVDDVQVTPVRTPGRDSRSSAESFAVTHGEYEMRARSVTSVDLLAIADAEGVEVARRQLVARCLLSVRKGGAECGCGALPEEALAALADRMAEADPQADVRLALKCPVCGDQWEEPFDIEAYFWEEVDAWAQRAVREVHTLATAYGWSEEMILGLSPARRRHYLELVER